MRGIRIDTAIRCRSGSFAIGLNPFHTQAIQYRFDSVSLFNMKALSVFLPRRLSDDEPAKALCPSPRKSGTSPRDFHGDGPFVLKHTQHYCIILSAWDRLVQKPEKDNQSAEPFPFGSVTSIPPGAGSVLGTIPFVPDWLSASTIPKTSASGSVNGVTWRAWVRKL